MGETSLRQLIHGPLKEEEENLIVSNCMHEGDCDFSNISFILPACIKRLCYSIPLPNHLLSQEDFIFSNFTSNGNFDFKKALFAIQKLPPVVEMSWNWI